MDERQLVEAHAAGDQQAFAEIVRRHTPELLNHAGRRLHDRRAAEDAVQETFLRAYRGLPHFNGEYRLAAWLHRICDNVCTDEARRRQRLGRLVEKVGAQPPEKVPDAEEEVLNLPDPRVRDALAELSEPYREALVLRYVDELPYRDVASRTGVSEENARARVHRARASLRRALAAAGAAVAWVVAPFRKDGRAAAETAPVTTQTASQAAGHTVGQAASQATVQAASQATVQAAPQVLGSTASQAVAQAASSSASQAVGATASHAVAQVASQTVGHVAPEVVGQVSSFAPTVGQVVAHAASAPAGMSAVVKAAAAAAAAVLPIAIAPATASNSPVAETLVVAGGPTGEGAPPSARPATRSVLGGGEDVRQGRPGAVPEPVATDALAAGVPGHAHHTHEPASGVGATEPAGDAATSPSGTGVVAPAKAADTTNALPPPEGDANDSGGAVEPQRPAGVAGPGGPVGPVEELEPVSAEDADAATPEGPGPLSSTLPPADTSAESLEVVSTEETTAAPLIGPTSPADVSPSVPPVFDAGDETAETVEDPVDQAHGASSTEGEGADPAEAADPVEGSTEDESTPEDESIGPSGATVPDRGGDPTRGTVPTGTASSEDPTEDDATTEDDTSTEDDAGDATGEDAATGDEDAPVPGAEARLP